MNNKKPRNRMGNSVHAGVTRIFNFSDKLRLTDPLILKVDGNPTNKSVQRWILENPRRLWDALYNKTDRLRLSDDSHQMLMQVAQQHFPELYKEKNNRRAGHRRKGAPEFTTRHINIKK